MRKNFLKIAALSFMIMACSDDDNEIVINRPDGDGVEEPAPDPDPAPTGQAAFVLNEVEYLGDRVEILNQGDAAGDLSSHWLCLGPGAYAQIGNLTTEGNVNLGAGEYLTVFYEMPVASGGLGLYSANQFANADAMVDFVQWGASGNARESVAVEAGIWTAGDFVNVMGNAENTIIYDGEGNGVANWAETSTPTFGAENQLTEPVAAQAMVVINEVQYGNLNQVELWNNGTASIDLSDYWLCLGPGQYSRIGTLEPVSGSINLNPGEFLVLPYEMPDEQGGLGFYSVNQFANPEAIVDFVQWGAGGAVRESVAVEAGIWTAGEFVPTVGLSASIEYDGEGDAASDWMAEDIPSLGQGNGIETNTTTFSITISNVMNYFNAHTFTTPVGAAGPGPLTEEGQQYVVEFDAVPGAKLTPVTMMGNSNDWFLAPEDFGGIDLFPNGTALDGVDIADQLILFDLGTEADNDPATFPPAGANVGPADPNPLTRIVDRGGVRGDFYITAVLDYTPGDGNSAGSFSLTITKLATDFVVTPGIVVLHALENPLFTLGEVDRGVGLEAIAEDGNPGPLFDWFQETGEQGAPLRLSSSISVFSPGVVYAFNGERDPFVLQGEVNDPNNGLEQIAEDGNNSVAVSYLEGLGIPVAASNETAPVGPGDALTFSLTVPEGQDFKFGFSTMLVNTNDWFIAYNNAGYPLFDESGVPVSGFGASSKSYLYDSGTEIDEPVGFGPNQAPRQAGPDTGAADENNIVRRVSALEDVQFGKGLITSGPGVVWLEDPRGGYNLVKIEIQAN